VPRRKRRLAFGSAAAVVVIGIVIAFIGGGYAALVAGVTLSTLGFGAIVLLVFLEIGLSEDHAREQEERERLAATRRDPDPAHLPWSQRPPRRDS
jgi:hypothetical protein